MTNKLFYPGPRFGLSYDPWGDGKTAIHGGYGLFWEHGTGYEANAGSLIGSAPTVLSETQSFIAAPAGTTGSAYSNIGAGGDAYALALKGLGSREIFSVACKAKRDIIS